MAGGPRFGSLHLARTAEQPVAATMSFVFGDTISFYYIGTIPKPLALYTPYNNRECLQCHDGTRGFEETEAELVAHLIEAEE